MITASMLRPYTLIYSKIHKAQSFVNHVMLDVILRAPKLTAPAFSTTLVMPKYRMLIDDINTDYVLIPLSDCCSPGCSEGHPGAQMKQDVPSCPKEQATKKASRYADGF